MEKRILWFQHLPGILMTPQQAEKIQTPLQPCVCPARLSDLASSHTLPCRQPPALALCSSRLFYQEPSPWIFRGLAPWSQPKCHLLRPKSKAGPRPPSSLSIRQPS